MSASSDFPASQDRDIPPNDPTASESIPCVLSFNANDPIGAGGVTGDALVIAAMGAHPLPIVTGVYLRDSRDAQGHVALDESAVADQARLAAEDAPPQVIKAGFVGSAEALAQVAAFASDYEDVPLVAYMPDLSWWEAEEIDDYLEAFRDLLLPQTAVLVGNNTTLRHWLLPESAARRAAGPADLARAVGELGTPFLLVTGLTDVEGQIGAALVSSSGTLLERRQERIDAPFLGAGDTLSAALAALLATGLDLPQACGESLNYLDQALDHGYPPGMGRAVPDRLFWAHDDEDENTSAEDAPASPEPGDDAAPDLHLLAARPHDHRH